MAIHAKDYDELIDHLKRGRRAERAVAIGLQYGPIDGAHHKDWVIDQMIRILSGAAYPQLIGLYESEEGYEWDTGIAP